MVFDSSSGFRVPDVSIFSLYASLVRLERWPALSIDERRGFAPFCPALVVELASPSVAPSGSGLRDVRFLRRKMAAYQANRAELAWLLPYAAEVWPVSAELQRIKQAEMFEGGAQFPWLRLDLDEIWAR